MMDLWWTMMDLWWTMMESSGAWELIVDKNRSSSIFQTIVYDWNKKWKPLSFLSLRLKFFLLRAQCKFACYIGDQADRSCEWWSGRQGTQCFTIQPKPMKCECSGTHVRSCEWKLRRKNFNLSMQRLQWRASISSAWTMCLCVNNVFSFSISDRFQTLKF